MVSESVKEPPIVDKSEGKRIHGSAAAEVIVFLMCCFITTVCFQAWCLTQAIRLVFPRLSFSVQTWNMECGVKVRVVVLYELVGRSPSRLVAGTIYFLVYSQRGRSCWFLTQKWKKRAFLPGTFWDVDQLRSLVMQNFPTSRGWGCERLFSR